MSRAARLTLVTGPTRSGKSRFAESLAAQTGKSVVYVATARRDPNDAEWSARLNDHRARRPAHWATLETAATGCDLARAVAVAGSDDVLVIESLGTWLAALADDVVVDSEAVDAVALEALLRERSRELVDACANSLAELIVVSEQTGWGIVPVYASARVFSSVLGRLTTTLARMAGHSYLVVSGFALDLRANATYLDIEENL